MKLGFKLPHVVLTLSVICFTFYVSSAYEALQVFTVYTVFASLECRIQYLGKLKQLNLSGKMKTFTQKTCNGVRLIFFILKVHIRLDNGNVNKQIKQVNLRYL